MGDSSICVSWMSVLIFRNLPEVPFLLNSLKIRICVLQPLQVWIRPSRIRSKTRRLNSNVEVKNRWFCSLHQNTGGAKSRRKTCFYFFDIQTHSQFKPKSTGLSFCTKASIKTLSVLETSLIKILSVLVPALEYCVSDVPYCAVYDYVSSRIWNF